MLLLVFLNTTELTRAPTFFLCIPDDRTTNGTSHCRSTSEPANPRGGSSDGRGVAQLGVSRRVRIFFVCAFRRWAASAPGFRSGFCAGSRLLVVRLVGPSVRVGHNTRARLCGGGGGGDGTWRAALCLSRASGSLLARAPFGSFLIFFRGRCEPRTPWVGPVGLPVGGWGFCVEIAL